MRTTIMAVMLAAPLSLGLLLAAAQAQEDPTTPPTPAPKHPCIDSPLRDLLANPAAVAVLNRDLPGMTSDPRLEMAKSMSLRQIARFPDAHLNGAKLKMLEADLEAAASALAAPSATASASDADTSAPAPPR
jgi:hypothetical protein